MKEFLREKDIPKGSIIVRTSNDQSRTVWLYIHKDISKKKGTIQHSFGVFMGHAGWTSDGVLDGKYVSDGMIFSPGPWTFRLATSEEERYLRYLKDGNEFIKITEMPIDQTNNYQIY